MHYRHSASSREGGDEYSSETSEMDSQGTLPTWIKHELADSLKAADGVLTSEEEEKLLPTLKIILNQYYNSATEEESQVNSERNVASSCSTAIVAEETPKNPTKASDNAEVQSKKTKTEKNLTSSTGSDTNTDKSTFSSSNTGEKIKAKKSSLPINSSKGNNKVKESQAKSPFSLKPMLPRNASKTPTKRNLLGRHVVNRGITSVGKQRNREDVLLEELENTKSEKKKVESQLEEIKEQLEILKENQEEVIRRKEEKDKPLEDEIGRLKQKLEIRDQEIQEFNKIVQSLKEKVECLQTEPTSVRNTDASEDSSSCTSPREEYVHSSKKASKICSLQ